MEAQAVQSGLEWAVVLPYIFGFMALGIAGWVANSISKMSEAIDMMKDSVGELNTNMAVAMSKQQDHERRLTRLEEDK